MKWIMVKGLTVFVCGLALFGLAACGGGGGDGSPASDKPEMTIMPPLADHPNTLADAAPIMDGQTVTGVIDSPDDVDFFRLPVTEDSRVGFMLDAEAGLEVALLDSEGNVLDIGETESLARVGGVIFTSAKRGFAAARVACGKGLAAVRSCAKKSFKLLAEVQTYKSGVKAVIEFLRGTPTVELLGIAGYSAELKIRVGDYIRAYTTGSDGSRNPIDYVVAKVETPTRGLIPGLSLTFDRSNVGTVAATRDVEPGRYPFDLKVTIPGTEDTFSIGPGEVRTAVSKILEIIVDVKGVPDLVISQQSASIDALTSKQPFTLSASVRNNGKAQSAATTLRFYRSTDAAITRDDTAVGTKDVQALAPNSVKSEQISLEAPSFTGTYYYGACVDTFVGETDTGNNCSSAVRVTVEDDGDSLDDVSATIPSSCPRQVEICVRDHQCEDGDEIRVSVNGNEVFSGELFNAAQCFDVPVREGRNSISLLALNGTGYKGSCNHADVNTGEIRIVGQGQSWSHRGGTGSRAVLNVTIGPASSRCP